MPIAINEGTDKIGITTICYEDINIEVSRQANGITIVVLDKNDNELDIHLFENSHTGDTNDN